MPSKHYQVPKTLVITVVVCLLGTIVSLLSFGTKSYIQTKKEIDARQDGDISKQQDILTETMQQMMRQDKAVGIIAKDVENHKENESAHAK